MKRTVNKKAMLKLTIIPAALCIIWIVGWIMWFIIGNNFIYVTNYFWDTFYVGIIVLGCLAIAILTSILIGLLCYVGFNWLFPKKEETK